MCLIKSVCYKLHQHLSRSKKNTISLLQIWSISIEKHYFFFLYNTVRTFFSLIKEQKKWYVFYWSNKLAADFIIMPVIINQVVISLMVAIFILIIAHVLIIAHPLVWTSTNGFCGWFFEILRPLIRTHWEKWRKNYPTLRCKFQNLLLNHQTYWVHFYPVFQWNGKYRESNCHYVDFQCLLFPNDQWW